MLSELQAESQITLPREFIERFGLSEGDKLEIFESKGMICIVPVVVYPKEFLDVIKGEIEQTRANIALGKQAIFDNVDALFANLEGN